MDINTIKSQYEALNKELKRALSTMEFTDRILVVKEAIKDLQSLCPHNNGHYDFSNDESCPYCGKHFKE